MLCRQLEHRVSRMELARSIRLSPSMLLDWIEIASGDREIDFDAVS